jgi:hypothetical protein
MFQSQFGGPGELNGPPGPPPGSSPGHQAYGPEGGAAWAVPATSPKPASPKPPDTNTVLANPAIPCCIEIPFIGGPFVGSDRPSVGAPGLTTEQRPLTRA